MIAELKINKNLKIPYYYQLYENIVESIEKNMLSEGDRLFGEIQLCEKYGVSPTSGNLTAFPRIA